MKKRSSHGVLSGQWKQGIHTLLISAILLSELALARSFSQH
ncbi:hypothetical protein A2U01_0021011, partial [Trifolium medium]|nr:hypothetical protein [Trifolium medium]